MNSPHAYKFRAIRNELHSESKRSKGGCQLPELQRKVATVDQEDLSPWETSTNISKPVRRSSLETLPVKPTTPHFNELMSTKYSQPTNTITPKSCQWGSPLNNNHIANFDSNVILLPEDKKARSLSPNRLSKFTSKRTTSRRFCEHSSDLGKVLTRKPSLRTRMRQFFEEQQQIASTRPYEDESGNGVDAPRTIQVVAYPILQTPVIRKLSVREHRQLKKAKFMNNYNRNVGPTKN